jgi:hypothetical protein
MQVVPEAGLSNKPLGHHGVDDVWFLLQTSMEPTDYRVLLRRPSELGVLSDRSLIQVKRWQPINQKRASSVEVIRKQVQPVSLHTR